MLFFGGTFFTALLAFAQLGHGASVAGVASSQNEHLQADFVQAGETEELTKTVIETETHEKKTSGLAAGSVDQTLETQGVAVAQNLDKPVVVIDSKPAPAPVVLKPAVPVEVNPQPAVHPVPVVVEPIVENPVVVVKPRPAVLPAPVVVKPEPALPKEKLPKAVEHTKHVNAYPDLWLKDVLHLSPIDIKQVNENPGLLKTVLSLADSQIGRLSGRHGFLKDLIFVTYSVIKNLGKTILGDDGLLEKTLFETYEVISTFWASVLGKSGVLANLIEDTREISSKFLAALLGKYGLLSYAVDRAHDVETIEARATYGEFGPWFYNHPDSWLDLDDKQVEKGYPSKIYWDKESPENIWPLALDDEEDDLDLL